MKRIGIHIEYFKYFERIIFTPGNKNYVRLTGQENLIQNHSS